MLSRRHLQVLSVVLTVGVPGCFQTVTYACEDNAQCRVDGAQGVCEPSGYCAYEDDACDGGRRYGPFAGDLADRCVDPEPGTTSSEGSGATGTRGGSESSSDATGCTTDCASPGTVLWSVQPGPGRVRDLAVWNDALVAVGQETDAWVVERRTQTDGALVDAAPTILDGEARGVAPLSGTRLVVAGSRAGTFGSQATVVGLDDALAMQWQSAPAVGQSSDARGVAVWSGVAVSVGAVADGAFAVGYDEDGQETFRRVFPDAEGGAPLAGVTPGAGGVSAVGERPSGAWLLRLAGGGALVAEVAAGAGIARGVASLGPADDLVVGEDGGAGWVVRVQGEAVEVLPSPLASGALADAAALDDGGWVVVGTDTSQGVRPWAAVWNADGSQRVLLDLADTPDSSGDAVAVQGNLAYLAGGGDERWLSAVVVGP